MRPSFHRAWLIGSEVHSMGDKQAHFDPVTHGEELRKAVSVLHRRVFPKRSVVGYDDVDTHYEKLKQLHAGGHILRALSSTTPYFGMDAARVSLHGKLTKSNLKAAQKYASEYGGPDGKITVFGMGNSAPVTHSHSEFLSATSPVQLLRPKAMSLAAKYHSESLRGRVTVRAKNGR